PSAGDIDGDGLPEIVFAGKNGQVFIYDINKKAVTHNIDINEQLQKAKASLFESHEILRRIAVGPLNSDQYMDLLILTESNHLLAFDVQANERIWYDRLKIEPDSGSLAPPNLADLNGDEIADAVLATSDHKIVVFNGQGDGAGERQIRWGYVENQGQHFVSPPVLADINKDSYVDVIIADYNSGVMVLSGFNGKIIYHSTPDSNRENAIIGAPLVADVSGNGWLDILLRRNNDSFSLTKTNSRVMRGSIFWGQLHQNPLQSGFLALTKQPLWKYYSVLTVSALLVLMLVFINGQCEWKRKRIFTRASSDN
ncbi:MAG: VCBS repeat-containing protein, partial [bacterium]|nr:VCBS repeat-containing protein [bacterium]